MSQDYNIGSHPAVIEATEEAHQAVNIPKWIILLIGICSLIVPFLGRNALLWFVDLSSVGASIAYFVTCLCAYKIAQTSKNKFISLMGMLVSIAFLVFLLTPFFDSNITAPSYYALIFWCVLGAVVYFFLSRSEQSQPSLLE